MKARISLGTCIACGKRLPPRPPTRGQVPYYCNDACKQKAYRAREQAKRHAKSLRNRNKMLRLGGYSVEWYTPKIFIDAVTAVLGVIELDPASCAEANATVQALRYYDQATDGLAHPWNARTVFLNPPYCKVGNTSNQDRWTYKLLQEYHTGHTQEAIALVNAATETHWFHRLFDFPICFIKGRVHFTRDGRRSNGAIAGSAFLYLGEQPARFIEIFSPFGHVVIAIGQHSM